MGQTEGVPRSAERKGVDRMLIIKDMKMPKSCQDCDLFYDQIACSIGGDREADWDRCDVERLENCPIVAEIPDNPTNGDVIKAMFPNVHVTDEFRLMKPLGTILYLSISKFQEMRVQEDWWNAPYKGVEE